MHPFRVSPPPPSAGPSRQLRTCRRMHHPASALTLALAFATALGCSGGSDGPRTFDPDAPLYAIMYEVYDDSGSNSYLSLISDLDLERVDPAESREFGTGRAFIQAYGDWLFVGDADAPTVTRYVVSDEGELVADGPQLSFANYGLTRGQFDSWNVSFISATKAYLMNFDDGTTILWNPTTMATTGDIPPPDEFFREGWSFESSPAAIRGNRLFRSVSWADYNTATYSSDYLLAVYDLDTDTLVDLVPETRCPVPGNLVSSDEAGNIYFSNWVWPVARAILADAPTPCVLRIAPDEEVFDADWTLDYGEVADGRYGAMFSYLHDGQALISVFHDEETSFDAETDPWAYVGSNHWSIWRMDLDTQQGAPIEGIAHNGGAFTPLQFDDRLILMVPGGDEVGYATQLYEVVDGVATPRVSLPGWSYQFVKLR